MKNTIKTILTSAMTAFATFFMVVYISCSKDKCSSVVCNNGGACKDGSCSCATGYEGDKCELLARDKFIRNWGANNLTASVATPSAFSVSVEASSGVSGLVIKNFHNAFNVSATASRDSITIPTQVVTGGHTVSGAGYIYSSSVYGINNTISISYTVTDATTKKTTSELQTWNG